MARYQVIISYDGTRYLGYQRQVLTPTVQATFEEALHQLNWEGQSILAAGRTDAGVHASGQVIAFDLDWKHSPQAMRNALNAYLPPDLAVKSVKETYQTFHPRYDATSRLYVYRVFFSQVRDPLRERYTWRVWPPADIETLNRAAARLVGTHDFSAFGTPPKDGGSTIRNVISAEWRELQNSAGQSELSFEVRANAFLYHMVRRLVFFLVSTGQGKWDVDGLTALLKSPVKELVQGLAPAQGLTLVEVTYT